MNDHPQGDELLGTARRVLLDQLLPLLPPDKVYDTLMVANAMAIAARELAATPRNLIPTNDKIAQFYKNAGLDTPNNGADLTRDLAVRIRTEQIPVQAVPALHTLLSDLTRQRLTISNPKYLTS